MFLESELKFAGISYDAAARFLGEVMSKDEINEEKFEEIVYTKNENVVKKKNINLKGGK